MSDGNILTDNECWNNYSRMYLQRSEGSTSSATCCTGNTQFGLVIDESNGTAATGNQMTDNDMFGCYLLGGSRDNMVDRNNASLNDISIHLESSPFNIEYASARTSGTE